MPHPLAHHPHFVPCTDPASGVTSYVLKPIAGPIQKAWYFTRVSLLTSDGYLGFFASVPPRRTFFPALLSLNPDDPVHRPFPHLEGSGLFDPDDPSFVYFPVDDMIVRQSIDGGAPGILTRMPAEILAQRHLFRLCTNLTLTADRRFFILDSRLGNQWLISLVDRKSGAWHPLKWFGREHHHAIAAPHDPTLFIINQGHWTDPITGGKNEMDLRIWLMKTDLSLYRPLDPELWFGHGSKTCHEWWNHLGNVQYCEYDTGIWEHDVSSGERRLIWSHPCIHGQVDPTNRYLVSDSGCYHWNERIPCQVHFLDRATGKEIPIVQTMPPQPLPWRDFRSYHLDPHPHFSADGSMVVYTTTALGMPSVALCPVDELVKAARDRGTSAATPLE